MRTLRRRSRLFVAWAALLVAANAHGAGASASDADKLFAQGREAARAGDFASALQRFQRSQQLDPAPGTLLNIADAEEHLGKVASAWEHFRDAITQLGATDERLPLAKRRMAALAARIPKLKITKAPGVPPFTRIARDGLEVAGAALGTDLAIDPGKHVVTVEAPGRAPRSYDVTVAEKERRAIVVEPGPPIEPAPEPVRPPPAAAASAQPLGVGASGSRQTLGLVIGGIGVAGIAIGSVTGLMVFGKKGVLEDNCPGHVCNAEGASALSSVRTLSAVSTASFVIGAAALASGAYLVLSDSPGGRVTAVGPIGWPGGGGVALRGNL